MFFNESLIKLQAEQSPKVRGRLGGGAISIADALEGRCHRKLPPRPPVPGPRGRELEWHLRDQPEGQPAVGRK